MQIIHLKVKGVRHLQGCDIIKWVFFFILVGCQQEQERLLVSQKHIQLLASQKLLPAVRHSRALPLCVEMQKFPFLDWRAQPKSSRTFLWYSSNRLHVLLFLCEWFLTGAVSGALYSASSPKVSLPTKQHVESAFGVHVLSLQTLNIQTNLATGANFLTFASVAKFFTLTDKIYSQKRPNPIHKFLKKLTLATSLIWVERETQNFKPAQKQNHETWSL